MKIEATIKEVSFTGISLLVLKRPEDPKHLPYVSITMRTDVAEYLKKLVDKDQSEDTVRGKFR